MGDSQEEARIGFLAQRAGGDSQEDLWRQVRDGSRVEEQEGREKEG